MEITKINDFPSGPKEGQVFEIIPDKSKMVSTANRLFNKYPTRYISAVPKYAIMNYSQAGDTVLDPFCGSGTSAVEAMLLGRNALSIDIDPFARLLIKAKTTIYSKADFHLIEQCVERLKNMRPDTETDYGTPKIPNIEKWFCERSIRELSFLKAKILELTSENANVRDYFLVTLAAIIRKCSNAENVSPKPYISTRYPKVPAIPLELFFKTEEQYRTAIKEFSDIAGQFNCVSELLDSNDARRIALADGRHIDLAVTSPPYINAYDYTRSLRFEDLWLGLIDPEALTASKKNYIGTETSSVFYSHCPYVSQSDILAEILPEIEKVDKKRAGMVSTYIEDMCINMMAVRDALKTGGHYVIVAGDSTIRNQSIPTARILAEIAAKNGYGYVASFKYLIRDRYLHLPRGNRGGLIKYDEILIIQKI